ncbi:glycosyltransferase [Hungatella hathewayi]
MEVKILQINAVYKKGSTGRTTEELHNSLIKQGYLSYVACPIIDEAGKSFYRIGNAFDHRLHAVLSRLLGYQGGYSYISTIKLLIWIDKIKPNIIHLRNLHSNYINLPLLLKYIAKKDIPVVITLHDCWFYTGRCYHYTNNKCFKWKKECGNCQYLRLASPSFFFDRSNRMLKDKEKLFKNIKYLAIVGVSDWITEEAKQSILQKRNQEPFITRIYNWIPQETFKPKKADVLRDRLKIRDKFVVLGVATRWSEPKGLNIMTRVSERLKTDTVIVLVGDMPEDISFPQNIISVGKIQESTLLAQYYAMADVFLNLSREESFGKVSAESVSCGTPVIAYASTANPEIVGEGCGIIIKTFPGIDEILEALECIKEKGKDFYSDKCIEFAQSNFNMQDNIKMYLNVYSTLLKEKENTKNQ